MKKDELSAASVVFAAGVGASTLALAAFVVALAVVTFKGDPAVGRRGQAVAARALHSGG